MAGILIHATCHASLPFWRNCGLPPATAAEHAGHSNRRRQMCTCDLLTCFRDNRQQLPASPQTGGGGSLAALEQLPCLQALALTLQLRSSSHQEQRELAAALAWLQVRQGLGSQRPADGRASRVCVVDRVLTESCWPSCRTVPHPCTCWQRLHLFWNEQLRHAVLSVSCPDA